MMVMMLTMIINFTDYRVKSSQLQQSQSGLTNRGNVKNLILQAYFWVGFPKESCHKNT